MTTNDDKKFPAVRGEILPPAPRTTVPVPRAPSGVVEAVFSGFFARVAARSVADTNRFHEAQQRGIQIATATARDLVRLQKALAELDDIDAILLEDQRDRDHGRAMAQQRRQVELRRADLEQQRLDIQQAQLDHERRVLEMQRQTAIQQADYGQQRDLRLQKEQLEKDRLAIIVAETDRLHHELLRDLLLRRAKGTASAEAIAAEAEEIKALQRFGELLGQHKPTETQRDELAELMMEQIKEARNYAASNAETVQVLDRLTLSFSNLLKRK